MSVTAAVRHKVADYDAWRTVYDGMADVQAKAGVTAKSVHRLVGDGNDLLVIHQFETLGDAEAFLSSDELRAGMQEAGVQGPPTIELFEDA
jgi:hypothetical protein